MGKRIKNWFIFWSVRGLLAFLRILGLKSAMGLGRGLGRRVFRLARLERERTLRHLSWAFEQMPEGDRMDLARKVFEHFGMAVAEVACARKIKPITAYMDLDPDSRNLLDDTLSLGKGVVFITGHLGNWELMARSLAALGYPINTIGQRSYDPRFTRLIQRFRDEGLVNTLWRGDSNLVEKMVGVLRRGEIMGLLVDQDTRVPGVFVDFFGRPAWTPTAGAVLARKTGAPVIMGFNHRKPSGHGYVIHLTSLALSSVEDEREALAQDTQAMTRLIEQHIRKYPEQWVWMHRRWKTKPEQATITLPPTRKP